MYYFVDFPHVEDAAVISYLKKYKFVHEADALKDLKDCKEAPEKVVKVELRFYNIHGHHHGQEIRYVSVCDYWKFMAPFFTRLCDIDDSIKINNTPEKIFRTLCSYVYSNLDLHTDKSLEIKKIIDDMLWRFPSLAIHIPILTAVRQTNDAFLLKKLVFFMPQKASAPLFIKQAGVFFDQSIQERDKVVVEESNNIFLYHLLTFYHTKGEPWGDVREDELNTPVTVKLYNEIKMLTPAPFRKKYENLSRAKQNIITSILDV